MRRIISTGALAAVSLTLCLTARAAIVVGSDGSDGAFAPNANITVDLTQAQNAAWNANNAAHAGKGVYDASKWAVVFKYTNVTIPAGVTVTFKNHLTHAPVVWLVSGNVSISGSVKMDGSDAVNNGGNAEPGPGGFRGGAGGGQAISWGGGLGYGGGQVNGAGSPGSGSYATNGNANGGYTYGGAGILPLVGGSGSAGDDQLRDGAGGGGAILIACANTISLSGSITAHGGAATKGGGAGGAIRLVADKLTGGGSLNAKGGVAGGWSGGDGRIRLEANQSTMTGTAAPNSSQGLPIVGNPDIFPPAGAPILVITQVGGVNVSADPKSGLTPPGQDVSLSTPAQVKVRLQATNVPLNWAVYVRVIPKSGTVSAAAGVRLSGDAASSLWEATVNLTAGISAIEAITYQP